ncbi:MAG: PilZ domain-containing protein [Gammaproteobacteria bacterium]|nr:PilZ domain-containing protein [Gammaproteobacteria bacterium]
MSADLQEFKGIIEQLKPAIDEPDFDQVFKSVTADVPKSKQFLIKMELKRIAKPCNQLIDLRGHVAGKPFPYEHKGKIHYLDEVAKDIFEQQLEMFGRYTIGVNEAVLAADNNHRILHKKEQTARLEEKNKQRLSSNDVTAKPIADEEKIRSDFGGHVVNFTRYGIRHEERMNFSIAVELQFSIGDSIEASTSDLSVSGAKVKIPAAKEVVIGQKVALYLTGLEKEFKLGLKDGIQYEIVGIDSADTDSNYIRLKRTFTEDVTSFDEFLGNFINGNKRRYKINLENTLDAILIKGFEQFYLPRITSLPVFIRQIQGRLVPTLILATENNRETLGNFSDENKNLVFQQILNEPRIERILSSGKSIKETTLYSFTHAKAGKLYFYSATSDELNEDENKRNLFLGFGAQKASWCVHKLQLMETSDSEAYIPLSIPDTADREIKKLNKPPSPRVQGIIKDCKYIAMFTPLRGDAFKKQYQHHFKFDASQLKLLKSFGHPKLKRYITTTVETIEYVNLRSEERYLYKTQIEIANPIGDFIPSVKGSTRDLSTQGLQVILDEPHDHKKGDVILLSLPELQKITKSFKLEKLPYEVMAISKNKTIMNLRTFEDGTKHHARYFFKKLIEQNIDKLTPAKMESQFPGLSTCLRNLTAKSMNNLSMYFSKENNKIKVNTIGTSFEPNLLHNMLASRKPSDFDVTLYPLLQRNSLGKVFTPILSKMKRADRPEFVDIFIRYRFNQEGEEQTFISQVESTFSSEKIKKTFIDSSLEKDIFCVFRIFLSRTGRPDMDYVSKELSYVGNYANHRAKELEERLWSVVGVGDIVDITEEFLTRSGYSVEQINQQNLRKNRLMD